MNECTQCNEDAKPDEWSDYDKKICINCGTNDEDICETKKEIMEL
jgi:hypothetical protein